MWICPSIVGVGTYHGRKEVDLHGKYVCPGLIDGHIHIESSMLCGPAFEQAVLPHGTTAVSYTHLDVYKRQPLCLKGRSNRMGMRSSARR